MNRYLTVIDDGTIYVAPRTPATVFRSWFVGDRGLAHQAAFIVSAGVVEALIVAVVASWPSWAIVGGIVGAILGAVVAVMSATLFRENDATPIADVHTGDLFEEVRAAGARSDELAAALLVHEADCRYETLRDVRRLVSEIRAAADDMGVNR